MKTSSHVQPANFSNYLVETSLSSNLVTSAREALKHSEIVYLLCKFHSHAHNPCVIEMVSINPVTFYVSGPTNWPDDRAFFD